jgi:hypothetical protein
VDEPRQLHMIDYLRNQLISVGKSIPIIIGVVEYRERLGGMLKYYCRAAA